MEAKPCEVSSMISLPLQLEGKRTDKKKKKTLLIPGTFAFLSHFSIYAIKKKIMILDYFGLYPM